MTDALYRVARLLGAPFRYRVVGLDAGQGGHAAIFVANHLGSLGPIQMILSMPVRFFPWIIADMVDRRRAPRYLYHDFVRPVLHLEGAMGLAISWLICQVTVPLLRGLGSIPVEKRHGLFDSSVERSVDLLGQGQSLLIFPEDSEAPYNPDTGMRTFSCGFTWLCYRHQQATGSALPLYPVAVSRKAATIVVGQPLFYPSYGDRRRDLRHLCAALEENVRALRQAADSAAGRGPVGGADGK